MRRKSQTVTMPHQLKLNCPVCNYPRLTNLSDHLTKVHGIDEQGRKCLLAKTHFAVLSTQPDQPQPSIPQSDSTPVQFGNSLPKTSSLPEQRKLPNPLPPNSASYENKNELIPCPYDSRISNERVSGTNVPVMDYDIFKSQIRHLACHIFPSKPKFLQAAYEEETKDPYRYLFLDFHPNSSEFARVRGNIFPYDLLEDPCCLYLPKDMQI